MGNTDVTKNTINRQQTRLVYSSETSILDGTIGAEGESNEGSYSLLLLELQDGNMHSAPSKANTLCENARWRNERCNATMWLGIALVDEAAMKNGNYLLH